jgi:hypothetical protein
MSTFPSPLWGGVGVGVIGVCFGDTNFFKLPPPYPPPNKLALGARASAARVGGGN